MDANAFFACSIGVLALLGVLYWCPRPAGRGLHRPGDDAMSAPKYQIMGRGLPTYWHVVRTHDLAVAGYYAPKIVEPQPRTWPTAKYAQDYLEYLVEWEYELREADSQLVWIEETRQ